MKERGILFKAEMVRAIFSRTKTQTRRVVKPQPSRFVGGTSMSCAECDNLLLRWTKGLPYKPTNKKPTKNGQIWEEDSGERFEPIICPYGKIGDVLWVRETFAFAEFDFEHLPDKYIYRADFGSEPVEWNWKPSLFMPREACRIRLEITGIRVERLNDISEAGAIAEGVERWPDGNFKAYGKHAGKYERAVDSYASLWESINGEGSWAKSPFCWVIEFKML